MEFYQNNLDQSEEKVYLVIEANDTVKAMSVLQEASIPVNGPYDSPVQIISHERIEDMNIEDEEQKQDIIYQVSEELNDVINNSWVDIVDNIDSLKNEDESIVKYFNNSESQVEEVV